MQERKRAICVSSTFLVKRHTLHNTMRHAGGNREEEEEEEERSKMKVSHIELSSFSPRFVFFFLCNSFSICFSPDRVSFFFSLSRRQSLACVASLLLSLFLCLSYFSFSSLILRLLFESSFSSSSPLTPLLGASVTVVLTYLLIFADR